MSTTLTNGLKLPDKGSVDWYADMQNNYAILDGAVGTVAEHTTALAGKAPLVHTHTKSDITDLFNSANVWTDLQSYIQSIKFTANFTVGVAPSSELYGGFNFGNTGTNIGNVTARVSNAGATYTRLYIGNKFANGALDPNGTWKYAELQVGLRANGDRFIYTDSLWRNSLTPYDSAVSIGDSNHQWNNLYAKNYYYNGVAWGLDKNNKWLTTNIFYGSVPIFLRGSDDDIYNVSPQSLVQSLISFVDKNNTTMSTIVFQHRIDTPETHRLCIRQQKVASDGYYGVNLNNLGDFYPDLNNTINLGTSTNKWKTLNGINPGALSLPDYDRFEPIDFSQYDVNLGWNNLYTPSEDGWLYAEIDDTATNSIYIYSSGLQPVQSVNRKYGVSAQGNGSQSGYGGRLAIMIPVRKNIQYRFLIKASAVSDIYAVIFYPCLGNV